MDKIVQNIVRQLQHLVTDECSTSVNKLYADETKSCSTGGYCATSTQRQAAEASYQRQCEQILTDENCFRISVVNINISLYKLQDGDFTHW